MIVVLADFYGQKGDTHDHARVCGDRNGLAYVDPLHSCFSSRILKSLQCVVLSRPDYTPWASALGALRSSERRDLARPLTANDLLRNARTRERLVSDHEADAQPLSVTVGVRPLSDVALLSQLNPADNQKFDIALVRDGCRWNPASDLTDPVGDAIRGAQGELQTRRPQMHLLFLICVYAEVGHTVCNILTSPA